MVSENIPPQRREVVVDEIGDEKQKEIPRKKSEGFWAANYFSNSWKDLVRKSKHSGRKYGHIYIQLCIAP